MTKDPKCPQCGSNDLAVERRPNGDAICNKCKWHGPYAECFKETFDQAAEKERKWFRDRGFTEDDTLCAVKEYQKYMRNELDLDDKRPFDKAPMFRRAFMMGYFYGRAK